MLKLIISNPIYKNLAIFDLILKDRIKLVSEKLNGYINIIFNIEQIKKKFLKNF